MQTTRLGRLRPRLRLIRRGRSAFPSLLKRFQSLRKTKKNMKKQKENLFLEKFSILNSQELSEEINWSSSCSSDYENTPRNDRSSKQVYKVGVLKRKRKKKVPKNASHLSVSILDTSRKTKNVIVEEKSPILGGIIRCRSISTSPILKPSRSFCKGDTFSSPILAPKTINLISPILIPKTVSPKTTVKVRKKLFNIGNFNENVIDNGNQNIKMKHENPSDISIKMEPEDEDSDIILGQSIDREIDENLMLNETKSNAKLKLVEKVKSFFDSNFSSQNASLSSQNTISEISTPKNSSKTSEELEILSCKTQLPSNNSSAEYKQELTASSSETAVYDFNRNSKKIKYKKDGLGCRLNNLLKKQKATLSLWQHERFLAANSNFIIPKGESIVFRIQRVNNKYGCHLVECVDVNDGMFLILINSCYVLENIVCETALKVYEPYNIVQYNSDCKLIVNVTKFECIYIIAN